MNLIPVVVCFIIIIILMKILHRMRNKRMYQLLKQFPSFRAYPLIGNAYIFLGSFDGLLQKAERYVKPYDRLLFWLGSTPCLALKKYEDIVTILNHSQNRDMIGVTDPWLGTGLMNAGYKHWRTSRRILNQAFSSDMLIKYIEVFNEKSSDLVEKLRPAANTGKAVDIMEYMMETNLDAILENSMGVSIQSSGKHGENFWKAVLTLIHSGVKRVQSPWLLSYYVYWIYLRITGVIKAVHHLQFLPTKILRERMNNSQASQYMEIPADDRSSRTIVGLLMKKYLEEPDFTETRMKNELLQIIFPGLETTSLTACNLMLMLAIHQDIQQKVYEEIIRLEVDNDGKLSMDDLNNHLKYLDQCIKETLRMYSPVIITTRRTHKEVPLKDGVIVPANMFVVAFIHFVNYDPELYENPFKWDPEHFNMQAVERRPRGTPMNFGFGPRSCIGSKYAIMFVKSQMVHILRNYHLSTNIKEVRHEDLITDLSVKPKFGYPIIFNSRKK
ncbi:cytochrome P450 4C1-like [Planococcus citri]|uniref:cytochrome P450 4C1-like n=1 Tax=Planococcus citri TaxID=170843 RepID=UPI0031F863BD